MLARNWLPRPSPLLAPATRPAPRRASEKKRFFMMNLMVGVGGGRLSGAWGQQKGTPEHPRTG
eukprot:gene7657-9756_t